MRSGMVCVAGALCLIAPAADGAMSVQSSAAGPVVVANDNRVAAGTLDHGVLTVRLAADTGQWQPNGAEGPALTVAAFREEGGALSTPGPLIRVPAGTQVRAWIRNNIPGTSLDVFGFGDRPSAGERPPLRVPAGDVREVSFVAREPGTYHYWGTFGGRSLAGRRGAETQLGGALIVDPPGAPIQDRVLVIALWRPETPPTRLRPEAGLGTINGRSWPNTERLDYRLGTRAHWRVVNLSFDRHAMHLHGMYFRILGRGDGLASHDYAEEDQPLAVTESVAPGATFDMAWQPERTGNWLFHCHMLVHMTPEAAAGGRTTDHHLEQGSAGMAGLVVGIHVSGDRADQETPSVNPRRFRLRLLEEPGRYGDHAGYAMDVDGLPSWRLSTLGVPGPVIALTRGEPVEVVVANEMHEPTAIHWHGIELESYFDGVPGWGGVAGSLTPPIDPGQSFTARFTPPRAGTFIYHTHWHDEMQLAGGLYGPLIVLEPGRQFEPDTDHVFVAGYDGPVRPGAREPVVLNGRHSVTPAPLPGPVPTPLRAGVPNRLRLINITPNNVALTFVLTDGFKVLSWRPLAKDGADLPTSHTVTREARQLVSVGETYDFEINPTSGQRLWLELRRGNGEWVTQVLLQAKE